MWSLQSADSQWWPRWLLNFISPTIFKAWLKISLFTLTRHYKIRINSRKLDAILVILKYDVLLAHCQAPHKFFCCCKDCVLILYKLVVVCAINYKIVTASTFSLKPRKPFTKLYNDWSILLHSVTQLAPPRCKLVTNCC